jgi:hypothetical protein
MPVVNANQLPLATSTLVVTYRPFVPHSQSDHSRTHRYIQTMTRLLALTLRSVLRNPEDYWEILDAAGRLLTALSSLSEVPRAIHGLINAISSQETAEYNSPRMFRTIVPDEINEIGCDRRALVKTQAGAVAPLPCR